VTNLKLGLVLSGGGAKGAYQLGIWKAMDEYDLSRHVIAVSGSSVGALNGFMFNYCDYESAEYIWLHQVDKEKFFRSKGAKQQNSTSPDLGEHFMGWLPISGALSVESSNLASAYIGSLYRRDNTLGLFSNSGIDELITLASRDIDYGKTYYPTFHVCAYEFMESRPKYFRVDAQADLMLCKKALIASSAIPLAFPPVKINGMHYYDGGCVDNIPIRPIHDQNLDLIIVVNIEGASTPYDLMSNFPYANILEIKPLKSLGGMMSAIQFDQCFINSCFQQGYEQGCHVFRDLVSCLESGMHPQVARSNVQSYINANLDPYQCEGISLESLSSNLKDFFVKTGRGFKTAIYGMGTDSIWDDVDQGYGYQLQKSCLSGVFRIVDNDNNLISIGSEILQTYEFWQLTRAMHMEAPDITDVIKAIDLNNQTNDPEPDMSFLNNLDFDL